MTGKLTDLHSQAAAKAGTILLDTQMFRSYTFFRRKGLSFVSLIFDRPGFCFGMRTHFPKNGSYPQEE